MLRLSLTVIAIAAICTTNAADEVIKCPGGECVKLHLCLDGTYNLYGQNLIDIRFNPDDPCEHYLLKCCELPDDEQGSADTDNFPGNSSSHVHENHPNPDNHQPDDGTKPDIIPLPSVPDPAHTGNIGGGAGSNSYPTEPVNPSQPLPDENHNDKLINDPDNTGSSGPNKGGSPDTFPPSQGGVESSNHSPENEQDNSEDSGKLPSTENLPDGGGSSRPSESDNSGGGGKDAHKPSKEHVSDTSGDGKSQDCSHCCKTACGSPSLDDKSSEIVTETTPMVPVLPDSQVTLAPVNKTTSSLEHHGTESSTKNPLLPFDNPGCGVRHAGGVGFRITGNSEGEAEYGEFPWMVAILKEEKALDHVINVYQCGGSLIHPQVVLTAAHCVQNKQPSEIKVRLGEWDTQTTNEIYDHQDRNVQNIIVHEEFYKGGLFNDFALLFLDRAADLQETVNTVCLPPQGLKFDLERCFAAGWGKNVFGKEGKYQVILKKIELPVVPHAKCQQALRTTRLGRRFLLHPSFMCAGGEPGKDTCKGDGGSPLVCPMPQTPDRYYQAGIVAWGIGCGDEGIPGVYANVAGFRNWIDEKLSQHGIPNTYYTFK